MTRTRKRKSNFDMASLLKELMQDYKDRAFSSTLPSNTPIAPFNRRTEKFPVFPVARWNDVDSKLRKRFTFIGAETLMRFVNEVIEYSEELNHHSVITISKRTVDITVWTRNLSIITEIDREFARHVDEIYKDVIHSEITHGEAWEDIGE